MWRSWNFNNFSVIDSKFLVTSGLSNGYNGVTSEIIDLSCSGYHRCPDWVDYPLAATGATGLLLEHVPVICGGHSQIESLYHDECYKVTANKAVLLGRMSSKRKNAASVVIKNSTLWVTGGYSGNFALSSSDFIYLNGSIYMGNSGWRNFKVSH